jgi:hypothetical protein
MRDRNVRCTTIERGDQFTDERAVWGSFADELDKRGACQWTDAEEHTPIVVGGRELERTLERVMGLGSLAALAPCQTDNFLGVPPEQQFVSDVVAPGSTCSGWSSRKSRPASTTRRWGRRDCYVDEDVVAEGPMRTQLAQFMLCGDGLCVGRDSGDAVSKEYSASSTFTGGTILQVEVSVGDDQYLDLEREAHAMMARE